MIYRVSAGGVAAFVLLPYLLSAPPAETPQFLVPEGVTPLRHEVVLTVDPRTDTFNGRMKILVRLDRETDRLWLHAKDLDVTHTEIELGGFKVGALGAMDGNEFLEVVPATPLPPGLATLTIDYSAPLDSAATQGLYRRKIGDDWYAFAVFPPIEARRAMPCFDEPRFKTPWRVTLRVRTGDRAFSNTEAITESAERGGWKRVEFKETQPLTALLVGLAVGPFDVLTSGAVRVITPRGEAAQGRMAAGEAAPLLRALEQYTGIPYPFGKLDLIAVPSLRYAAIETPGLIAFQSRLLLVSTGTEATAKRREIEELVAHELAHQWFGNLVTPADWNDVWLSEGAATWLSRKVLDREILPFEKRETTMREDQGGRMRVVRQPVRSRADSLDAYNNSVYEKGGAVLMMLEGWLGEERLRNALHTFLRLHEFASASSGDLAGAVGDATGPVLDLFLGSKGVPIVAGEVDCERPRPVLRIASTLSPVPVCWRTDSASACAVVDTTALVELPEGSSCPAWVVWNAGGFGYYRSFSGQHELAAAALPHLTIAEKLTLAHDLRATRSPGWRDLVEMLLRDPNGAVSSAARDALRP